MFGQTLSCIKAEERHTPCIVVYKFLAYYATISVINYFFCWENRTFF